MPTHQVSPGLDTTAVSLLNAVLGLLQDSVVDSTWKRQNGSDTFHGSPLCSSKIFPQSLHPSLMDVLFLFPFKCVQAWKNADAGLGNP